MDVGERIKAIREFRGMTQRELGLAIGYDAKTARARISQYEIGNRVPKEDTLLVLAKTLRINIQSIRNYSLDTPVDVMEYLFWLDEKAGRKGVGLFKTSPTEADMRINAVDGERERIGLFLALDGLEAYLSEWFTLKDGLKNGSVSDREYFEWLINWPDTSKKKKSK
jgi:transcriptional regulator with XRE-family HTH domain